MKEFFGRVFLLVLLEGGIIKILFSVGRMDADWRIALKGKDKACLLILCALRSADIARYKSWNTASMCFLGILAGCLLTACVMDIWERRIYRYVWWAGYGAVCGLLVSQVFFSGQGLGSAKGLLLFIFLQFAVFQNFYGRADCSAFCVCAATFTALGKDFRDHVIHMALVFCVLTVTQILKRNIAADGNLKNPVPLVPYITAVFWFWVDFVR